MPGKKHGNIPLSRSDVYEALKRRGMSKKFAARIAHEGKSKAGRSAMSRKAARTRKARGR